MILDFVILRNGLPVFTVNFDPEKGVSHDQQKFMLISGFFSAIDTFIGSMESLGDVSEIQMSSDTYFAFKKVSIPDGLMLFIAISDAQTPKSYRKSLVKETSQIFLEKYDHTLKSSWKGDIEVYSSFHEEFLTILNRYSEQSVDVKTKLLTQTREYFDDCVPKNIDEFCVNATQGPEYQASTNQLNIKDFSAKEYCESNSQNLPDLEDYCAQKTRIVSYNSKNDPDRHDEEDPERRIQRTVLLKQLKNQYAHYKTNGNEINPEKIKRIEQESAYGDDTNERNVSNLHENYNGRRPSQQYGQSSANSFASLNRISNIVSEPNSEVNLQPPTRRHSYNITNSLSRKTPNLYGLSPKVENNMRTLNHIHGSAFECVPRKNRISVGDFRFKIGNELERAIFFLIDGRKSIEYISDYLNVDRMLVMRICKKLVEKSLIEF